MAGALAVTALLCICTLAAASPDTHGHFRLDVAAAKENLHGQYQQWQKHFGRAVSHLEDAGFKVWADTVSEHLNSSRSEALVNNHAAMSDADFRAAYLGQHSRGINLASAANGPIPYRYRFVEALETVDWREHDIIGPIKNQHANNSPCGCCWSFATTAAVECVNALVSGENLALSEQQLIDCDHTGPFFDLGCKGGDFNGGFEYIIKNGGLDTEADYPYLAKDSDCDGMKVLNRKVVTIDGLETVPPKDETAMMKGVTMHPITVALCVGDWIKDWRAYTGGILHTPGNCDDPLDHAMIVVGYGEMETEDNAHQPYWLLKNSWGAQWGENGFLRLKRGLPGTGHLGLLSQPGYPVKIHPNPGQLGTGYGQLIQQHGQRAGLTTGGLTAQQSSA